MKPLKVKDLALGMMASIAEETPYHYLKEPNRKTCVLPVNYKQNIQNIMCAGNGWFEEFSRLIDTEEYLDSHFAWEIKFSGALQEAIEEMGKEMKYNYIFDRLEVEFTPEEIESILSKFTKPTRNILNHFSRLVVDRIYSREYQEQYHDYSAMAVQTMKEWNKAKEENPDFVPERKY